MGWSRGQELLLRFRTLLKFSLDAVYVQKSAVSLICRLFLKWHIEVSVVFNQPDLDPLLSVALTRFGLDHFPLLLFDTSNLYRFHSTTI